MVKESAAEDRINRLGCGDIRKIPDFSSESNEFHVPYLCRPNMCSIWLCDPGGLTRSNFRGRRAVKFHRCLIASN